MSKDFTSQHGIDPFDLEKSGLDVSTLTKILSSHESRKEEMHRCAEDLAKRIIPWVPEVHSVRFRVKDGSSLLRKILRKKIEQPQRQITAENYHQEITDLVGVRILHLFKDEWEVIHHRIASTWNFHRKPEANYREGDQIAMPTLFDRYSQIGCEIKKSPHGYRSVHYIIQTSSTKTLQLVELQVRTIFEEGWSEINHRFDYPNSSGIHPLPHLLGLFNILAGFADGLGGYLKQTAQEYTSLREANEKSTRELREALERLSISEDEKNLLQDKLTAMSKSSSWITSASNDVPLAEQLMGSSLSVSQIDWGGASRSIPTASLPLTELKTCSKCSQVFASTSPLIAFEKLQSDVCPACRFSGK